MNTDNASLYVKWLKQEVAPALGCTEPVAISFAAAYAAQYLDQPCTKISGFISANLYKNAMTITSGQLPINPLDGTMPEDIAEQARQSLENVKAIVEAAGLTVGQIVKTTVFVKDLADFAAINAAYEAFFIEHQAAFPARSCVEVARLPKDAGVEIEAIAFAR